MSNVPPLPNGFGVKFCRACRLSVTMGHNGRVLCLLSCDYLSLQNLEIQGIISRVPEGKLLFLSVIDIFTMQQDSLPLTLRGKTDRGLRPKLASS